MKKVYYPIVYNQQIILKCLFSPHMKKKRKKESNHLFRRNSRYNPSPLSVMIAVPNPTSNERRLETSYTVQLGSFNEDFNNEIKFF